MSVPHCGSFLFVFLILRENTVSMYLLVYLIRKDYIIACQAVNRITPADFNHKPNKVSIN